MKAILEIIPLIENIKLKFTDFLSVDGASNTDIFYQKVLAGEIKSDKDAAQFFFNASPSHSNYKYLKRIFKEKLANTLFFINPKKAHSDYERAYLYCSKYLFLGKILIHLSARNAGIEFCQKVLNKAIEFELTEFVVQSSKQLRVIVGTIIGDEKKFNYFNEIYKEYKKIWEAESLAEEYYCILTLPYVKSKTKKDDTFQKANQYYKELAPYLQKHKTPYLQFIGNLIKVVAHLSINDYDTAIIVCEKAILFFEQKPYSYKSPLRVFSHNLLICYIQQKNYPAGKKTALKALSIVKPGTYSWFINKELHLTLALHAKEYGEAYIILSSAINHHKFNSLRLSIKERWLIHAAYVSFLVFIGKINAEEDKIKKFKLGQFLNSIPTFSQDKRGLNIPILIIQILFMVVKKDYDQSIDRFDSIKKYCSRYLRKGDNLRSNCFINMLLQIPDSNFHKARVEQKAKRYWDKLLITPLEVASQATEIEIIPYEDLWQFVLESLEFKTFEGHKS